jgi:hypothetical protein
MQVHKAYALKLLSGTATAKQRIELDQGNVIAGFITVANSGDLGAGFTNIGIESSNGGKELVDAINYSSWAQRSGGSYLDSAKPFFITDRTIYVTIDADNVTTDDVDFQLVLIYEQQKCS